MAGKNMVPYVKVRIHAYTRASSVHTYVRMHAYTHTHEPHEHEECEESNTEVDS